MKKQNKTERSWLCQICLPQEMSLKSVGIGDFKECGSKYLALPDEHEMEERGRQSPIKKSVAGPRKAKTYSSNHRLL